MVLYNSREIWSFSHFMRAMFESSGVDSFCLEFIIVNHLKKYQRGQEGNPPINKQPRQMLSTPELLYQIWSA